MREAPRLTIGMPIFNNAPTIRRALDALLAQSFPNFRILISDDGSTDDTVEICQEYARRDDRIELVRQSTNLNYGNFRYVLQRADTPFFMFAAGDDYWHPDFVARLIEVLDRDSTVVCAVSRVAFLKDGGAHYVASGTRALLADSATNIAQFLAAGDDNSRMYGVFRTASAQRAFPHRDFFGYDWAFSIGTLCDGKHVEVPEVLMWRDHTSPSRYIEYVRRDASGTLARLFPMMPLTSDLALRLRIPLRYAVLRELVRLNLTFHQAYLRRYHPVAASVTQRVVRGSGRAIRALARPFR